MGILDQFKLNGRTALVTGCTRGIGKAMSVALAEAGADIIGVSSSLEAGASEVEQEVRTAGRSFKAYQCDFSKREELHAFILRAKQDTPVIDILVNNAGTQQRHDAVNFPDDDYDTVIKINQDAPFILAREFGKDMVSRGYGKIIFVASLLTFQGGIRVPAYAASKGAIGQLTMALSNEWASKGVNVNAIAPGYITTEMNKALINDKDRNKALLARIPAGRWGKPEDFKGLTVFLASDASSYIHGCIYLVDGGWMGR